MTERVPTDRIEVLVGTSRHPSLHLARAVSSEETVYILHSEHCRESRSDLRGCPYSEALDDGIDLGAWDQFQDRPVVVWLAHGELLPALAVFEQEQRDGVLMAWVTRLEERLAAGDTRGGGGP